MSKTLVTYELVKQKAEDLLAFGISPTQKQIRAALGSIGSMETINKHLRQFWAERQGEDWEFSISREFAAASPAPLEPDENSKWTTNYSLSRTRFS